MATLVGHTEEVLDASFDLSGQLIATASADGETLELLLSFRTVSCTLEFLKRLYFPQNQPCYTYKNIKCLLTRK